MTADHGDSHSGRYDGYADAVRRGIEVGFVPLERSAVLWLPEERAVLIDATMPERRRHAALAHGLTHADLEDTPIVRLARAGLVPRESVERSVHRLSACAQAPTGLLLDALGSSATASDIAAGLGITSGTLCWRLASLDPEDARRIPSGLIDRIDWDESIDEGLHCIWPDTLLSRRPSLRSMAGDLVRHVVRWSTRPLLR